MDPLQMTDAPAVTGAGLKLLAVFLTFVLAEVAWSLLRRRAVYNVRETLISNIGSMVGNTLLRPFSLAWKYAVFALLEPLQVFALPPTAGAFLVTFVVADGAYYWYHRFSHEVPILWTLHHTHHSSPWMNLTTAVRLNWVANFVSPLFFAPLILVGFAPAAVTGALALGLFYQFFLHTEAVPRLGWCEGTLLNTPAAHRVHHGANSAYIDKNYAGALIVWDRLFGTYAGETEPVRYGVTTGFVGHNPVVIQLAPLWKYLRRDWKREREIDDERSAAQRG